MKENVYRLCYIDQSGNYYGDVIQSESRVQAIQLFKEKFDIEPSAYVFVDRVISEEVWQ